MNRRAQPCFSRAPWRCTIPGQSRAGGQGDGRGEGNARMAGLDDYYNIFDLRAAAKRRLPRGVFEFVDRGTAGEVALANNRAAFERLKLKHRALVDMRDRKSTRLNS